MDCRLDGGRSGVAWLFYRLLAHAIPLLVVCMEVPARAQEQVVAPEQQRQAPARKPENLTDEERKKLAQAKALTEEAAPLWRDPLGLAQAELKLTEALRLRKEIWRGDHTDVALNLSNLAGVRESLDRPGEAEPLYEQALAMRQRLFPGDNEDVATSISSLARVRSTLGRPAEAEPLFEQALAMNRRLFPGDHTDVASSLHSLARVRESLGRPAEAEPLYEQELAMNRRLFRGDHNDVAWSLTSLGSVRESLGRPAEAEPLYEQALAMRQRLFPGDHQYVASSLHSLARVRESLGRPAEAEPLYEQELAMNRRLFRGDHQYVAWSLTSLARVTESLGRPAEAEPLYEQALAMRQRLFPGDHRDVATSLISLALVRDTLGRSVEAEPLYEQALAMNRRLFPGDHPDVVRSLNSLAYVRQGLGRATDAVPLFEEALAMNQRLFPGDHADVAWSLRNLACACAILGRSREAEPLFEQALAMHRRLFQGDHPDVAISVMCVALAREALGRSGEAESLYEQAVAMNRRLFPGDHPNLAISLISLVSVRQALGRPAEAEPLCEETLAMYRRLFKNVDEPAVALSLTNLASVRRALGRTVEAEPLYEQALAMNRRLFPGDHSSVAISLNNVASVRQSLGKFAEAEPLYQEALAMSRRLFKSTDHPIVVTSLNNLGCVRESLGRAAEAEPLYQEALAMADRLRLETHADVESRALMAEKLDLEATALHLALVRAKLGRPEEAFAALEAGRARALLDLLALQKAGGLDGLLATLPPEFAEKIRAAQKRELELRASVRGIEKDLTEHWSNANEATRQALLAKLAEARQKLGDAVAATNILLGKAVPATRAQNPQELQARLQPGEVVLEFGWLRDDVVVAMLTPQGALAVPIEGVGELGTRLERLASDLGVKTGIDEKEITALAAEVVPASLRPVLQDARRVIVVPTGPLSGVPMDLLLGSLAPKAAFVQAPSALLYLDRRDESLQRIKDRVAKQTLEKASAVVLARPRYLRPQQQAQLAATDPASRSRAAADTLDGYRLFGAQLADLPGTAVEAHAIDAALEHAGLQLTDQRVLLLGADASVPRLRAEIARLHPRVLHLATHGLLGSREHPLEAALALTMPEVPTADDMGFLTLEDLLRRWAGMLTDTDLVVLSACDTGRGTRRGDAEFSLPWGFFFSGATGVVASLWPVDDVSTALLMARFHEGRLGSFGAPRVIRGWSYAPGKPMLTIDALDEAKTWLRSLTNAQVEQRIAELHLAHDPPDPALRDHRGPFQRLNPPIPPDPNAHPFDRPYYWAPFVLLGSPE